MSLSTARNLKFVASFFLKWWSKLFVRCRDHIVITTCIRLLERPQIESLVFFVVPALLAMLSICWLGWEIFANVAYFDGYFANGPFQLLNPLRRLSVGQTVGQDFFVFHGIGLVWLHYPIFDILGRDLFASEISRYTIPAILHLIAAIALGTSFFRTFTVRQGFYAFIFIFFSGAAILQTYTYLPENASLGVRSAVPLFLAAALVHPRPLLLAAPLLAACLIVSVEHGIAAILSLGVAVFACLLNRKTWKKSAFLCLTLLLGTTIAAIVLFLTSNGNLLELVRFSLIDIPTDQFWYFGSSPNLYLYENWQFLLSHVETRRYLLVWSFGWLAVIIFWSKRPEQFIAMTFLMSYATFGVVSQFGYIFYGNLHAPERAGFAVLLLTLFCVPIHAAIRTLATACLLAYLTSWIPYMMRQHYTETLPNQSAYLSNYWKSHIEAVKQVIDGKSLWSTYAGLPESHFGIFLPSPYDYIIHALGPRRRADYLRTFEQVSPDVIRLDNRRSWVYGNWLLKANWPFHRAVFANYDLAHSDEFSTLWTKRQVPVARGSETKTDIALNGCFELELPRGV